MGERVSCDPKIFTSTLSQTTLHLVLSSQAKVQGCLWATFRQQRHFFGCFLYQLDGVPHETEFIGLSSSRAFSHVLTLIHVTRPTNVEVDALLGTVAWFRCDVFPLISFVNQRLRFAFRMCAYRSALHGCLSLTCAVFDEIRMDPPR